MESSLFIVIGLAAGLLAGFTVRDRGLDLAGDVVVGAFCALIGGQCLQSFGLPLRQTLANGLLIAAVCLAALLAMSLVSNTRKYRASASTYA